MRAKALLIAVAMLAVTPAAAQQVSIPTPDPAQTASPQAQINAGTGFNGALTADCTGLTDPAARAQCLANVQPGSGPTAGPPPPAGAPNPITPEKPSGN